jgi:hypothetical protein
LSILLLVLLAAGSVDLVRLWVTRAWAYRAAEAAALAGVAQGRDYGAYVATGAVALHAEAARSAAENALRQALQARGITTAAYDVRVHPTDVPTTYSGYPPLARAGMTAGDWSPLQPGVAVYLEVPVQPLLYGWVNGNAPVLLHVFAAAEVVTAA